MAVLAEAGITATAGARPATRSTSARPVEVFAGDHAVIHGDVPVIPNACYLIGGRLLHPGDSLTVLDRPVEILALPTSAPWMAVKEAVEYFRAVNPAVAIPDPREGDGQPGHGLRPADADSARPTPGG